jgi:carbon monoxide dehydrogenase subunit G
MKLNGTHKFKASSTQVFNAILDPEVLKSSIPGCNSVAYASPDQIVVEITTPLPGLRGPFPIAVDIANKQAPSSVELQVQMKGKDGSVNAVCKISVADEAEGTLLTYDAKADLTGVIAIADNPIGQPIVKASLNSFFKNFEKALEASLV